ncbi:MAG TPA: HAD-IA family hydrolase [Candidatus Babeliales bacterium]|nr:HAD-IA family hydrolase [Candidatus Babeliales bacterium]
MATINSARKHFLFLVLTLSVFAADAAKTVLWDIGGVLFKPDMLGISYYELGWTDYAKYIVFDQKSPFHIKDLLFEDILYRLNHRASEQQFIAYLPDGGLMPPIMMDWLKGKITGQEIVSLVFQVIKDLDGQHYFSSDHERIMLEKMVKVVFDPQVLGRYTKPISGGIELVASCAKHGCTNMIISNWDPISFSVLMRSSHGRKGLRHFDPGNIFISGSYGIMKPDSAVFRKVLEMYQLNPSECFFVDDQIENIHAAEALGIKGYWLQKGDYKGLKRALIQAGFLPAD